MNDSLVLNADASPLSIVPLSTLSWQEAIKLVYLGHVAVLAYYDDWKVHSPSITLPVPSVIILNEYIKAGRVVKFNRSNILLRDEYKCQFCGEEFLPKELTLDHYIPRAEAGPTRFDNISAACGPCNFAKAHHHDMKPIRVPYKPTYHELVEKRKKFPTIVSHESWLPYTGWNPEKVTIKHQHK
jgi:5-methylcytosine-specific restriction endonuclease McrA